VEAQKLKDKRRAEAEEKGEEYDSDAEMERGGDGRRRRGKHWGGREGGREGERDNRRGGQTKIHEGGGHTSIVKRGRIRCVVRPKTPAAPKCCSSPCDGGGVECASHTHTHTGPGTCGTENDPYCARTLVWAPASRNWTLAAHRYATVHGCIHTGDEPP